MRFATSTLSETTDWGTTINTHPTTNGNEIATVRVAGKTTWGWEYWMAGDTKLPTLCGSNEPDEKAAVMAANRAYRAWLEE